jgi:hypothetical protein
MQCPACQYRFTFRNTLSIVSPYNCPCPACKAPLTLGKQGTKFAVASALGGAAVSTAGICLDHCQVFAPAVTFAVTAVVFILAAGAGEWYCWKNGILLEKPAAAR